MLIGPCYVIRAGAGAIAVQLVHEYLSEERG
jgi:hypothetical protein